MQQQNSNALMYKKEQRLDRSKREEVIPRYKFVSPLYHQKDHENARFEQKNSIF
jgi:hypothetical protein